MSSLSFSVIITTVLYLSDALRKNFLNDKFDYKVGGAWLIPRAPPRERPCRNAIRLYFAGVGLVLLPVGHIHQPALPPAGVLLSLQEEENLGKVGVLFCFGVLF